MRRTIPLLIATVLTLSACASTREATTPAPARASAVAHPCRTATPRAAAGSIPAARAAQWTQRLGSGPVGDDRSAAFTPPARSVWLVTHGRVVVLSLARHRRVAPCCGTGCAA